jgi:ADP-ribosyl-[dinitrogen reductase] hydrolase
VSQAITKADRFRGSIIAGAVGDAFGSAFENVADEEDDRNHYPFGKPIRKAPSWKITDDTQLTLATCEAIVESGQVNAGVIAAKFAEYYRLRKITGIGSSTLKALQELEAGGHWSQSGRRGEYAAGNGAAMRIAPLAFFEEIDRETIRNVCNITHNNDEAYVGALCVVIAIQEAINGKWATTEDLLELLISQIPDTRVRDRLIEFKNLEPDAKLLDFGKLGNSGFVAESVPLAIIAASKVSELGFEQMFNELVEIGGDTDTICSIAGQIAGALKGLDQVPRTLVDELSQLPGSDWVYSVVSSVINCERWG